MAKYEYSISIADEMNVKLEKNAIDYGTSRHKLINEILKDYYRNENPENDESIIKYKYESIERKIQKMNTKVEELGKLFIDYLMFYFRTEPGVPSTDEDYKMLDKGTQSAIDFLQAHRNKIVTDKEKLTFMQTIFGSLLEDVPDEL